MSKSNVASKGANVPTWDKGKKMPSNLPSSIKEAVQKAGETAGNIREGAQNEIAKVTDTVGQAVDPVVDGLTTLMSSWVAVTVDGKTVVETEGVKIYTSIIGAVEPPGMNPPKEVIIRCGGSGLVAALSPLTRPPQEMRSELLSKFGISVSDPVLVKNPVVEAVVTATIVFGLMAIVAIAPVAIGTGAILCCLGVAIIMAVALGYQIDVGVEQTTDASLALPGDISLKNVPVVKVKLYKL